MKVGSGVRFDAEGFPVVGDDDEVIQAAKKVSEARRVSPCSLQPPFQDFLRRYVLPFYLPFVPIPNRSETRGALHTSFRRYL